MLRSFRFWLAVVLVGILAVCMICRFAGTPSGSASHAPLRPVASGIQPETVPLTEMQTEPSAVCETSQMPAAETTADTVPACTENTAPTDAAEDDALTGLDASAAALTEEQQQALTQRFQKAAAYSSDLIGWIYLADSEIDYPVVQGTDNSYYLSHAPDGRKNRLGTIFLDCRCAKDFSEHQNILYGHNMQYGMFGDIRAFRDEAHFRTHRCGWLQTADGTCRIDFFALVLVDANHTLYDVPADSTAWLDAVRENSLYITETELSADDRFIALSTCAVDYETARALLIGKLVAPDA